MVPYITASIGLVEMTPDVTLKSRDLIAQADNLLYKAKEGGRNKMELQKVSSPVSRK